MLLLPSEALDLDALSSALLFAEIWQRLPAAPCPDIPFHAPAPFAGRRSGYLALLSGLHRDFGSLRPHCLLPLPAAHRAELLWRRDLRYLLQFLAPQLASSSDAQSEEAILLGTLEQLFHSADCGLNFGTEPPIFFAQRSMGVTGSQNARLGHLVLLDRHQLPGDWLVPDSRPRGESQALPMPQREQQVSGRVLAIWDHRPDSGALPAVPLRCIERATSCVSLLLDCALRLEIFSHLSKAACLLAIATLHLDSQQYGSLLDWEQVLYRRLRERLCRQNPRAESPAFLAEAQLQEIEEGIVRQRREPELDLFQQANSDVKVLHFALPGNSEIPGTVRVAIGTVAAGWQSLQRLCENDTLSSFASRCLARQAADFLVLLHRLSAENPERAVSFLFSSAGAGSALCWDSPKIDFLLLRLRQRFPCTALYCGGRAASGTELVQWRQQNPRLSRKDFIPVFRKSFAELLDGVAGRAGWLP